MLAYKQGKGDGDVSSLPSVARAGIVVLLALCIGCWACTASTNVMPLKAKSSPPGLVSARGVANVSSPATSSGNAESKPSVRLSPGAARIPELVDVLSRHGERVLPWDGAVPGTLESLYDDPNVADYWAKGPGVLLAGPEDRLDLVVHLADFSHGAELRDPPSLAAMRIVSLRGLERAQVVAMIELAMATSTVEGTPRVSSSVSSELELALKRASAIAQDPRMRPDCRAPCQPWPWQTAWSVQIAVARAEWAEGSRRKDSALLEQAAELVRRTLSVVPKATHPLTRAVSDRLLGAVLQSMGEARPDDASILRESLAATERALATFSARGLRYEWALTEQNIQSALASEASRTGSLIAADGALAASDRVLSVLDQRTPNLRARALLARARLLRQRWLCSTDHQDLAKAVGVAREAALVPGLADAALRTDIDAARCSLESDLASELDDVSGLRQAVKICEHSLVDPSLPEASAAGLQGSVGRALARLAVSVGDSVVAERALGYIERSIESSSRAGAGRVSAGAYGHYAWGLLELSRLNNDPELLQRAWSSSEEWLRLTSRSAEPLPWGQVRELQGGILTRNAWNSRVAMQLADAAKLHREARAAFLDSLGSFSKAENPMRWAQLQRRIGDAFAWEGEASRQMAPLLNQAIACYQLALKVSKLSENPEAFADAHLGLGRTYLIWAEGSRGRAAIQGAAKRSAAAFRTALEAYQKLGRVKPIARAKAHLADALDVLQRFNRVANCDSVLLRVEATTADPHAHGQWEPAQETLDRYRDYNRNRTHCPGLPDTFWQQAREAPQAP